MKHLVIELSEEQYLDLTYGLGDPGFCLACGAEADGCEPDARNYKCEACGAREVFGVEECLMMNAIHFTY